MLPCLVKRQREKGAFNEKNSTPIVSDPVRSVQWVAVGADIKALERIIGP